MTRRKRKIWEDEWIQAVQNRLDADEEVKHVVQIGSGPWLAHYLGGGGMLFIREYVWILTTKRLCLLRLSSVLLRRKRVEACVTFDQVALESRPARWPFIAKVSLMLPADRRYRLFIGPDERPALLFLTDAIGNATS